MDAMIKRCELMTQRYQELDELLMSPQILSNSKELAKLGKEQARIRTVVEVFEEFKKIMNHLNDAKDLINTETDEEIVTMLESEILELEPKFQELKERLEGLLVPKDPEDEKDAILEIRGAAGGDEGNIFAGDLYRMYIRYAELQGWKTELLEASEAESGGYTLISFFIKGDDVYRNLKFESGAHRVQRVPKTETQGRIHTSTATVLVMPDNEEAEMDMDPADLTFETHRASGAGGQHVNKTDSAVRITHVPTGISVNCQDGRSQHDNRDKALKLIRARVLEVYQQQADAEKGVQRRSKIGKGDRSEKIRTYNYPQNRVTDHRIGLTLNQLDRIIEGKLDDVIEALLVEEQRQKLAGESNGNL